MMLGHSHLASFAPPQKGYVTYVWPKDDQAVNHGGFEGYHSATLLESRALVEQGTTGLRTWGASFALAQYLLENPSKDLHYLLSLSCLCLSNRGSLGKHRPRTRFRHRFLRHRHLRNPNRIQHPHPTLAIGCEQRSDPTVLVQPSSPLQYVAALAYLNPNLRVDSEIDTSSSHPSLDVLSLDWSWAMPDSPEHSQACALAQNLHPDVIIGADVVCARNPLFYPTTYL